MLIQICWIIMIGMRSIGRCKMDKTQYAQISDFFLKNTKFISGKYFWNNDEEIEDIDGEIVRQAKTGNRNYRVKSDDIKDIKTELKAYGEPKGTWPELKIARLAKAAKGSLKELPFPLDEKQLQIINILLFHPNEEVFFITTGIGGSGKSTFLNIITQLFDNDTANCSLSDLANQFNVAEAIKHRLICSDELSADDLDLPILKTLASKQYINANGKHQTAYTAKTQSALFFCCNEVPRIDSKDSGILRRIVYYARNTKIENPDMELKSKEYTDDELLTIARHALLVENPEWRKMFDEETR